MNRKAVAVLAISAIGFLVAIILFYNKAINLVPGPPAEYLGETQVKVYGAYIEGERQLLYIDMAVEYAFDAAGGAEKLSAANDGFLVRFGLEFSGYLDKFNSMFNAGLNISNYTFYADNTGIWGVCNKDLNLTTELYDYKFRPNFRVAAKNRLPQEVQQHYEEQAQEAPAEEPVQEVPAEEETPVELVSGNVKFVVMSDIHTFPEGGRALRIAAADAVKALNPDLVVMTGDIVSGDPDTTLESRVTAMWSLFDTETRSRLGSIPIAALGGNHDMYTSQLLGGYTNYWNEHRPAPDVTGNYPLYYSFDFNNVHFVMLKSNRARMEESQLEWLADDLGNAKSEGKASLVFSHYALAAMKLNDPDVLQPNARLKDILKQNNIIAFIHGDTHVFFRGLTDGINVINLASVAGVKRKLAGAETNTPRMIMVGEISNGQLSTYELIEPDYLTQRFDESVIAGIRPPGFS